MDAGARLAGDGQTHLREAGRELTGGGRGAGYSGEAFRRLLTRELGGDPELRHRIDRFPAGAGSGLASDRVAHPTFLFCAHVPGLAESVRYAAVPWAKDAIPLPSTDVYTTDLSANRPKQHARLRRAERLLADNEKVVTAAGLILEDQTERPRDAVFPRVLRLFTLALQEEDEEARTRAVLDVISNANLQPWTPARLLPEIDVTDLEVVCWLALLPDETL